MAELSIPAGVDAITTDWLTAALGPAIGRDARVDSFTSTRIGEGVGFLGELARVGLTYGGTPAPDAPDSVIVKLPTQVPEPRAMAGFMGFYEREVGFYREFAADVGVRVPRAYHVAFEPATVDFALVLEDIRGARTGDQVASCTLDEAKTAVRELARLHGRWWRSDRLQQFSWLPTKGHAFYQILKGAHQASIPGFLERFGDQFDPVVVRCAVGLAEKYDEYLDTLFVRPLTLAHSDYRLDNMMFGEPGTPDEIVILDWQLCQASVGMLDLQYFISGNLRRDAIARHTDELLDVYYASLRETGVRDYGFDEMKDDYARASLILGLYVVTGAMNVNPDAYNERGHELIDLLFGSLADSMVRYEAERFLPR